MALTPAVGPDGFVGLALPLSASNKDNKLGFHSFSPHSIDARNCLNALGKAIVQLAPGPDQCHKGEPDPTTWDQWIFVVLVRWGQLVPRMPTELALLGVQAI